MSEFWDRQTELAAIQRHLRRGGFGYVTGRRRVGKTALLQEAVKRFGGLYHQAVEGTPQQQLLHLTEEIRDALPLLQDVTPKTWGELFRLLSQSPLPKLVVFDEFPYWTHSDPTLPSVLQKWIDHGLSAKRVVVLISGSSQSMLHAHVLDQAAPLYGRASLRLDLHPLSYQWFCRALRHDPGDPSSFTRFALVGGVPHYWKLMPRGSVMTQVDGLYFDPVAMLAEEPIHLLRDEGVSGSVPKALLDLIGRGVRKPSELAARLGMPQGHLSRPLALLLDLGLIHRELPFGESLRTTKRVLYSIRDPALAFYYGVYLAHRGRWRILTARQRAALIHQHTAQQWEEFCRQAHPGAARYWEQHVELDLVWSDPVGKRHVVAECKWAPLSAREERTHLSRLRERFGATRLSRRLQRVEFQLLSQRDLRWLARQAA